MIRKLMRIPTLNDEPSSSVVPNLVKCLPRGSRELRWPIVGRLAEDDGR
jgi:hypothetical protein